MSFSGVLILSLVRAAVVAGLAVAGGMLVANHLTWMRSGWKRVVLVAMLVMVMLTPALLTGYGYMHRGLSLIRYPSVNEAFYATLLALRWMPLAVAMLYFMPPPPLSRAAVHVQRMLGRRGRPLLLGAERNGLLAAAVVFLLAFQDFELASLLVRPAWSVWLFDAQVQGLALQSTLRFAGWAVGCELVVIAAAGWLMWRTRGLGQRERELPAPRAWRGGAAWAIVLAALSATTVIPMVIVVREMLPAAPALLRDFPVGREMISSMMFAAVALAGALVIARVCDPAMWGLRVRRLWLILPGLLGPLVLAIAVQAIFQTPALDVLYDTPVPLLAVLVLLLTPPALALRVALRRVAPGSSVHLASMLGAGEAQQQAASHRLRWALRGRMWLAAAFILFLVGYFELVAGDLLHPVGMATAPKLLYNLMHYEHSHRLSAMVIAVGIAPVPVFAAVWAIVRFVPGVRLAWSRRSGD